MLRWCQSTVRALGGHDTNPSLHHFFSRQTLPTSRFGCIRARTDAAAPVANLVEKCDVSVSASSSAQSCLPGAQDAFPALRFTESHDTHFAISTLRQLLSPENAASNYPVTCSPTIIRSLYYRAESRNHLGMLDSRMLTLLISLFGSLSIDPCVPIVHRHPLASRFLETSTRRTHWAFILKVGRHKLTRRMPLQGSDRFWLMRAELAIVRAGSSSSALSRDAHSAISRARTHYHIIRRHSRHPEVHAYYLETLFTIREPRLLDVAAGDLSFLLRNHRVCHQWLQRLLYRLVVQYGEFLSTQSQKAILDALWSRAFPGTGEDSGAVPENCLPNISMDDSVTDTATIARSLSTTLFDCAGHLSKDQSVNSFHQLFSVLSPTYALPLRWRSLVLFSTFNSSRTLPATGSHWTTTDHAIPHVVSCWQVIFGLATVEMKLQKPSFALATQPSPTEGVLETTHTLYQLWRPMISSSLVSRDLSCVVITSFLRVASILGDAALFHNCQDTYLLAKSSEGPDSPTQKLFAAQHLAAAVRVQGPLPSVVSTTLEAISPDLKQQHRVLASAVEVLASVDPSLAYSLYTVAPGKDIGLDPGAIYALAMSFAQRGAFCQAIHCLSLGCIPEEKRGILVSTIARSLRENPRARHPPNVFVAIVNELSALYRSHLPPQHFRGHLEQLFVVLARHGRGRQVFPVILSIVKRSPDFFQPRFFVRYSHVLLRHRQISTASKLLDAITAVRPKAARSPRISTNRIVMQTKPFQVFKRVTRLRGPASLRLSSRLRRSPYAGPQLELSLQELLKSGRVLAAKHIFACAAATISPKRCTALGNILLHGVARQRTSRNGRRVRKVLALMENLFENYGFRPDRVTANIMIKAMISWRPAFDSLRLREVFDQLVRGGYPAADYSPLHLPFGTRQTQLSGSSGLSKLPSFVSFEKHTKPLFKMFVKAFYSCNDVEAARKVVGILKVEEYKNGVVKEARQRARSKGRVKAGQRDVIPLAATVS